MTPHFSPPLSPVNEEEWSFEIERLVSLNSLRREEIDKQFAHAHYDGVLYCTFLNLLIFFFFFCNSASGAFQLILFLFDDDSGLEMQHSSCNFQRIL